MKFTGIVAPLAVAGTASAAAIPQDTVQSALTELHGALGGVTGLLGGDSPADLSQIKTTLQGIESKLQGVANCKRGMPEQATDMASSAAAKGITTPVDTLVSTGGKTVNGLTDALKERQLDTLTDTLEETTGLDARQVGDLASGVTNTVQGTVAGVEGEVESVTTGLQSRQAPLSGLETALKSLFGKITSGALTPEMVLGALNPSAVQGLVGGVLSGLTGGLLKERQLPLGGVESVVKGLFAKVQSGALTPEMLLSALNASAVQNLLGGVLSDVTSGLGGNTPLSGFESLLHGLFSKVTSGALTPSMILGALNPTAVQALLGGVLSNLSGGLGANALPLGGLETVVQGLFAKVLSGALTPSMLLGALNPTAVQGLLGGVLGNLL